MSLRDQPTPNGLRYKIFEIVEKGDPKNKKSLYFDYFIIGLVLLNVVAIVLKSYEEIQKNQQASLYLYIFEVFSVVIFTIEYLMRMWTAPLKYPQLRGIVPYFKFGFSFLAIINLLAILPFYLPIFMVVDLRLLRMLRIIRLLRILKLNRYSRSLSILGRVLVEKKADLLATIFIALILMIIASTLMYNLESKEQPKAFPNIIDTLWWAVATLTTVGYGDVYPVTGWGRLLSSAIALLGIGIVALPTGILSSGYLEELQATRQREAEALAKKEGRNVQTATNTATATVACICPHCQNEVSFTLGNATPTENLEK